MGIYIGLAALVYVISGIILFIYDNEMSGNKNTHTLSGYTIFCPVINTIAVYVVVIKFIIKAIRGLIDLIIKL